MIALTNPAASHNSPPADQPAPISREIHRARTQYGHIVRLAAFVMGQIQYLMQRCGIAALRALGIDVDRQAEQIQTLQIQLGEKKFDNQTLTIHLRKSEEALDTQAQNHISELRALEEKMKTTMDRLAQDNDRLQKRLQETSKLLESAIMQGYRPPIQ